MAKSTAAAVNSTTAVTPSNALVFITPIHAPLRALNVAGKVGNHGSIASRDFVGFSAAAPARAR
jgi:hypothetical protein